VLDFLWESQGGGELPYPLELRSHGETVDERARLRNETFAVLRDTGVLDRTGAVDPRLSAWLTLLAGGEQSIDSVIVPGDEQPRRAMVAVESVSGGVLAEQRPDGILLRGLHPGSLASTVVDELPPGVRGTETSFTIPAVEEKRSVLLAEPRVRGGQFGANHRSTIGGRTRARVLAWFDIASGRYLMYRKRGPDGREWLTVAPADPATLRHRLAEMLTAARS
jgi:hypothetical protein